MAGWVFAIGLGLAVVYGPYSQTQYTWKMAEWIIYGVMFRIVWAIALAWVIFACHNGWGGKSQVMEIVWRSDFLVY